MANGTTHEQVENQTDEAFMEWWKPQNRDLARLDGDRRAFTAGALWATTLVKSWMTPDVAPEYAPHQCAMPGTLSDEAKSCRFCDQTILWGKTTTGKAAPFDRDPPYPNHWITCPNQGDARKAFPRER